MKRAAGATGRRERRGAAGRRRAWIAVLAVAFSLAGAAAPCVGLATPPASAHTAGHALPDWSGVWTIDRQAASSLLEAMFAPVPGNPMTPRMTPVFERQRRAVAVAMRSADPSIPAPVNNSTHCLPLGMPAMMVVPAPLGFEFLFTPGRVTLLSEADVTRRIYTDGRPHSVDPDSTFAGESIGHWEGQSLVVDTTALDPRAQLLTLNVHDSGKTHVTERIHLAGRADLLQIDTTVEDPVVLLAPWRYSMRYQRAAGNAVMGEYVCDIEHNRDHDNGVDLTPPPVQR